MHRNRRIHETYENRRSRARQILDINYAKRSEAVVPFGLIWRKITIEIYYIFMHYLMVLSCRVYVATNAYHHPTIILQRVDFRYRTEE